MTNDFNTSIWSMPTHGTDNNYRKQISETTELHSMWTAKNGPDSSENNKLWPNCVSFRNINLYYLDINN
jgi:hypothetical protein